MGRNYQKRKSKKPRKCDRHHVIPSSRGGSSSLENIANTDGKKHEFYHALFGNKTPVEIVEYLVSDFWKENWTYVNNAYARNNGGYNENGYKK